ncbi:Sodium/calcium exchanger protein-domain-containing protein [Crucibulum laeve]|uniref:Sodium/calcium exchanger protein-domain-containing protein n=1 Tax=Crucibulum laeve TaxID=68775 RepID=A0A5C3M4R9_9AGAR|nr:Sodium/calcium exchanger protein-domain-containing protein [Crucibulum laeve]
MSRRHSFEDPRSSSTSPQILTTSARYDSEEPSPDSPFSQSRFSQFSDHRVSGIVQDYVDSGDRDIRTPLPSFWSPVSQNPTPYSEKPRAKRKWSGIFRGWQVILLGSWFNVLLLLLPISRIVSPTVADPHALVFSCCILALIPLVRIHDLITRDLAIRLGGSRTGLLNASMSNIVEIVVAISALRKCELKVVQSALVGSILSKLLLVLGLCFFAGGVRFTEQGFDATATQLHSSLLSISAWAILLPVAYHFTFGSTEDISAEVQNILHMSHGVSIVLLFIYIAYLIFQLWSHPHLYNDHHNKKSSRLSVKVPQDPSAILRNGKQRIQSIYSGVQSSVTKLPTANSSVSSFAPPRPIYASPITYSASSSEITLSGTLGDYSKEPFSPGSSTIQLLDRSNRESRQPTFSAYSNSSTMIDPQSSDGIPLLGKSKDTSEDIPHPAKEPQLSWTLTVFLLISVTVCVSLSADWLVESMDGVSTTISKEWVGLILLPAITSVAECITAVRVSVKDELTLSISVAAGSTIQTALFVIPFMVILGWAINKPLSLLMDPFQSLVLYISVQTMGYVVADGKSNWLEGMILICLYIIIAVAFWFYPGSGLPSAISECSI